MLNLIGKHDTGLCDGCMVKETEDHVLLYCELYDAEREWLFERVRLRVRQMVGILGGGTGL